MLSKVKLNSIIIIKLPLKNLTLHSDWKCMISTLFLCKNNEFKLWATHACNMTHNILKVGSHKYSSLGHLPTASLVLTDLARWLMSDAQSAYICACTFKNYYFFILKELAFFYFICLDLFCIIIIIIIKKSRKWLGLGVEGLFSSSSSLQ